jgi:acetyl-CoA carboxylase biotin carboxyl carrier protein
MGVIALMFGGREVPRAVASSGRNVERQGARVDVEAQITGNVWKIEKAVGDVVAEEDVLLIIESMKMEIPVESPSAGTIREIRVAEGQSVEEGELLVVLES